MQISYFRRQRIIQNHRLEKNKSLKTLYGSNENVPSTWFCEMEPQLRIALFEPDIPQNTGAILRLAACLGVGVDIIE